MANEDERRCEHTQPLTPHEQGTLELVLAAVVLGMIPACTCPAHAFVAELQAQAVADRN